MKNLYNTENIFTEYPDIVSRKELQNMLNIGNNTAFNLLNSGEIKSIKIGNVHKIPKINIIAFLNKNSLQMNADMIKCCNDTVGN